MFLILGTSMFVILSLIFLQQTKLVQIPAKKSMGNYIKIKRSLILMLQSQQNNMKQYKRNLKECILFEKVIVPLLA